MPRDLVISASRTKDLVRFNAGLLAKALSGEHPVRFGLAPKAAPLDVDCLGALVLWTCDPVNLTEHGELNRCLKKLADDGVLIALQLTVTGFGGTCIEPGVPDAGQVRRALQRAIDSGIIKPKAVTLRFDPFASYRLPDSRILSNADLDTFERVVDEFHDLGITRFVTSAMDHVNYPHVEKRLARLGIGIVRVDAEGLVLGMDRIAADRGVEFSVCCNPIVPGVTDRFGCIDGRHLNSLTDPDRAGSFTEVLHNKIGKQRPECRCTYSRDIGHTTGFRGCYSFGSGCLYCYAQRGLPKSFEQAIGGT